MRIVKVWKPARRFIMFSRNERWKNFFYIVFSFIFTAPIFPQESPKTISNPSHLFNVPMAEVLRSAEVSVSGGSSFGMESKSALIQNLAVGLGGNCIIPVNDWMKKSGEVG
jgi:hypothetical protein